ncbi:MAG: aspartate ammonia-lyase, partial [Acidobacteria bacterium]|nr:aspartate ammonia-lyase [Acidobacteriota bacterium]
MAEAYRIERDTMGEVRVPVDARWGAQTQRAVENFPISGQRLDPALLAALARVKGAAAVVNARLKVIDSTVGAAIAEAAAEV